MGESPIFLVNATRRTHVYVHVDGKPVPLPKVSPPIVLSGVRGGKATRTFAVVPPDSLPVRERNDGETVSKRKKRTSRKSRKAVTSISYIDPAALAGCSHHVVTLNVDSSAEPSAVLNDLPVLESVIYLVDADVKFQFPHREDFATIATFSWVRSKETQGAGNTKKSKKGKKGKKGKKSADGGKRAMGSGKRRRVVREEFPLASISVDGPPVAHPDTPALRWE